MNIIQLDQLKPSPDRAARFQGRDFSANTSFFVVNSPPGKGVNKHRHPYEEIFIILKGEIQVTIDGETKTINRRCAIVIPPNTWHEFNNVSSTISEMVTIHNSPKIIQEDYVA